MATDQTSLKKQILDISRDEEQDNKRCVDCQSPHPQWASANNAVFLCIQCAGIHRGFGVHISFVRSVTMDSWKAEEVAKMKLGGNSNFRNFLKNYEPASDGGYREGMSANELYHSWAATQWREKLAKELIDETFTPSAPPPNFNQPSRPVSSQSTRKSRSIGFQAKRQTSLRNSQPPSPSSHSSPLTAPAPSTANPTSAVQEQKAAAEAYLENLGRINASRPDNLPPSQGGKYSGFGSSPSPLPQGPQSQPSADSFALSSQNLPTFQDISQNPIGAFSKGWSLLSSAVSGAGKAVNDNILQPGMERVRAEAPGVQERFDSLAGEAGKRLGQVHGMVKEKTGVDVQEGWGNLMGKMRDLNIATNPSRRGYQGVAQDGWTDHDEETSALYKDDDTADGENFFERFETTKNSQNVAEESTSKPVQHVEKKGWDDWKEF